VLSTFFGYGRVAHAVGRYEASMVAPFTLLVPVVGSSPPGGARRVAERGGAGRRGGRARRPIADERGSLRGCGGQTFTALGSFRLNFLPNEHLPAARPERLELDVGASGCLPGAMPVDFRIALKAARVSVAGGRRRPRSRRSGSHPADVAEASFEIFFLRIDVTRSLYLAPAFTQPAGGVNLIVVPFVVVVAAGTGGGGGSGAAGPSGRREI